MGELKMLGDDIRALRHKHNLSRKELARVAFVSEKSIISYEQGKRIPSRGTVAILLHRLENVPFEEVRWDNENQLALQL